MADTSRMKRVAAVLLTLSAAGTAFLVGQEGVVTEAMIPVKGDRPTYGVGATYKADGSPVRLGDTITKPEAIKLMKVQVSTKYEAGIKHCLGDTPLTQGEYDSLVDAAYNLGDAAVCRSGMVRHFKAGNHAEACNYYLKYRFSQGRDCSLAENKRVCGGVWTRRLCERAMCNGDNPLPQECAR